MSAVWLGRHIASAWADGESQSEHGQDVEELVEPKAWFGVLDGVYEPGGAPGKFSEFVLAESELVPSSPHRSGERGCAVVEVAGGVEFHHRVHARAEFPVAARQRAYTGPVYARSSISSSASFLRVPFGRAMHERAGPGSSRRRMSHPWCSLAV